jgi:type IV secretion system protein VirD4
MITYTEMHDYIKDAIDTYPKEIYPGLSRIVAEFNQKFSPYHFLIKSNWEPIHDKEKRILLNHSEYNRFCFFSKKYDLLIDICQNPNNPFNLIIKWYIESAISPIQSITPNPIQEEIDAFKLYSILNYGGNAKKTAIEFLRHRPNLHHFFRDLGIDPNNIPDLPCKYPPPPLTPRKLIDQLPSIYPSSQIKPSQTSSVTIDEKGQVINPYSSTEFMSYEECQTLGYFNDGIPLGTSNYYNYQSRMLCYKGDQHLITVAPTGSGKNTAVQIPTLLEYDASTLVIDPKGECAIISARYRNHMGHEVFILNPFNILKDEFTEIGITEFHGFNPLAFFNKEDDNFVADVSALSEALIITDGNDPYWSDSARDLISCLIMYVCINEKEKNRHLPKVRELLTQNEEDFLRTMLDISESDFLPMAQKSRRFLVKDDRSNSSVIATAITQTLFLDDLKLIENLKRNDFDFLDMKKKKMTVYIVLPAKFLSAYSRWFRLLITSALDRLMSTHKKGEKPVLFMIDEFPILGRLSSIETAIGLARGYGIQIWIFIQDLHQLFHIYKTRAESFLANTGVQQYFTPNDMETAERISKRIGNMTIHEQKATEEMNTWNLKHIDFSVKERPLMYPIDIIGFENYLQIVFFSGNKKPIIASKNYYYQNNSYINRYDKNPYRSE